MDKEVVLMIGTLLGATISAMGAYAAALAGRKTEAVKRDAVMAGLEVASYHRLERLYADQIAAFNNESYRTVLNRMRSIVESEGLNRPTMTSREAQEIVRRWK